MSTLPFTNHPVNIPVNRLESLFLQQSLSEFRDNRVPLTRVEKTLINDIISQLQLAQNAMAISGNATPVAIAISQQESEFLQNFLVGWKREAYNASSTELGYASSIAAKLIAVQGQESPNVLQPVIIDDVLPPPNFGDFGPAVGGGS